MNEISMNPTAQEVARTTWQSSLIDERRQRGDADCQEECQRERAEQLQIRTQTTK
jgi:hypothetical protein